MMRRIVVAGAVLAAVGLSPGGAGAAPEDPFVFHFKGRAASAVLTDCPPPPAPVGTECRAVSVFAAEQRVKEDGQPVGGAFVSATLFDVTITGGDPPFVAVPIGDGFTEDASVQITGLTRGAASAVDVPLCEQFFECAPGDPESVSVSVEWTGFGPVSASTFHEKTADELCFVNFHNSGQLRFADAVGEVDGETWSVPVIAGFIPTLEAVNAGSIERCDVG
jgi:hypothetical protein